MRSVTSWVSRREDTACVSWLTPAAFFQEGEFFTGSSSEIVTGCWSLPTYNTTLNPPGAEEMVDEVELVALPRQARRALIVGEDVLNALKWAKSESC